MAQKLFIGGLSFSTSNERLREVFAQAGVVESAAVVTDRETGRSRGFGFVEMATADEADIREFVRSRLAGYKLPRAVVFVDQVQRAPNGKGDYPWAKEAAARGGQELDGRTLKVELAKPAGLGGGARSGGGSRSGGGFSRSRW